MALRPIDIILQGKDNASSVFSKVAGNATAMGGTIVQQGAKIKQSLTDSAAGADTLSSSLGKAGGSASDLSGNLEKLRNGGAVLAGIGAAGLALSEHFISAGLEADRLNAKMGALLEGAGIGEASEQIKKLAFQLAGLTGGDDDTIAAKIAAAVASGRVMGLKEYGIVLSGTAKEAIKSAAAVSDLAGRQETLNQVMLAGGKAVDDLRAHTDSATAALGDFNVRWDNVQESVGMGAAHAKASILGGILLPILEVVEASPDLQTAAGYFTYVGSGALAAAGSVLGLASQVGILAIAFPEMAAVAIPALGAVAAAIAPIAAVALIAAAAIYALDRAMHWKEDQELQANIEAGKGKDAESLAIVNKSRVRRGLAPIAGGKSDSPEGVPGSDIDALQAQLKAAQSPSTPLTAGATMPTGLDTSDEEGDTDLTDSPVNSKAAIQMAKIQAKAQKAQERSQLQLARINARTEKKEEKSSLKALQQGANAVGSLALGMLFGGGEGGGRGGGSRGRGGGLRILEPSIENESEYVAGNGEQWVRIQFAPLNIMVQPAGRRRVQALPITPGF